MTKWLRQLGESKKPLPLLSFPGIRFLKGVNVRQMVTDSALQAACMKEVADRVDAAAAVSFMDLSVEAEAFGAAIEFFDDDVPAVIGALVSDEDEAEALSVPEVGAGRTACTSTPSGWPRAGSPTVPCWPVPSDPFPWPGGWWMCPKPCTFATTSRSCCTPF
jgi:hypothetical protein